MAKLFDEIFGDRGAGDVDLLLADDSYDMRSESVVRLRCHSLILMQHPYFCKMLGQETQVREGARRELRIAEPREEFLELLRFMYTGNVDLQRHDVLSLLALADKYCIDEVFQMCLKQIKENFDADTFYSFYELTTAKTFYRDRLTDQFVSALNQRRNLCSITCDRRWCQLPVEVVEAILCQDDLPVSSEAEVLTLVTLWLGKHGRSKQDVVRLMGACRKCDNIWVHVSDIVSVTQALGLDVFSSKEPRSGLAVWDPDFVIHNNELDDTAGPQGFGPTSAETERRMGETGQISFQLGGKDVLHQEPGWTYPGTHRCRVTLVCTSWSHLERRVLRASPSVSPAPWQKPNTSNYPTRISPRETMSDGTEQVDHQIICGVSCGLQSANQRHGVRISQREKNAIYLVEDLQGKQSLNVGGTTSSVTFDLELLLGEASKNDIRRCRFALLRGSHRLSEEWLDVSAKDAVRFYFSSYCFDKNSSYCISVKWLAPEQSECKFYMSDS